MALTRAAEHLGYVIAGRIGISHTDGPKADLGPRAGYRIAPGHDAWVIGDEPFVGVEFKGAASYAKA